MEMAKHEQIQLSLSAYDAGKRPENGHLKHQLFFSVEMEKLVKMHEWKMLNDDTRLGFIWWRERIEIGLMLCRGKFMGCEWVVSEWVVGIMREMLKTLVNYRNRDVFFRRLNKFVQIFWLKTRLRDSEAFPAICYKSYRKIQGIEPAALSRYITRIDFLIGKGSQWI